MTKVMSRARRISSNNRARGWRSGHHDALERFHVGDRHCGARGHIACLAVPVLPAGDSQV